MGAVFQLYAPTDITPLQVWNLPLSATDTRPLWQALRAENFTKLRANRRHFVLANTIVEAVATIGKDAYTRGVLTHSRATPQYLCSQVLVYGGLAQTQYLPAAFAVRSDVRIRVSHTPREYVKLVRQCWRHKFHALACDVGQASIKLYPLDGTTIILQRDRYLPFNDCDPALATHFIGCALKQLATTAPPRTPLLLALPWPLTADLVPGESTYNTKGRRTFMQEIADTAQLASGTHVIVANDATLAAECARFETSLLGNTLAITLGHGPGAAILHG